MAIVELIHNAGTVDSGVVEAGNHACAQQRCVCGSLLRAPQTWSENKDFAYAETRCRRRFGSHRWGVTVSSTAGTKLYRFS